MTGRHKAFLGVAGVLCLVSVIFQISSWIRHPRWFRGNLHAHSSRNDGDSPPADVVRWYRDHGYQFLALSDFIPMADLEAAAGNASSRFLILNATEPNGQSGIHVSGIGASQATLARDGLTRRRSLFDNVEAVRDAGAIPSVSHPARNKVTFGDLIHLDGEFLLDINERPPDGSASRASGPTAEQMWDELLSAGRTVYGFAADDGQYFKSEAPREYGVPGRGWVVVRADTLDRDVLFGAIRKGDFYASTGVALHDIRWDGREMRVFIGGAPGGRYRTTFLGPHARVLSATLANPAIYRPSAGDTYIRAHIEDQAGHSAWTQAVRLPAEGAIGGTRAAAARDLSREIALALDAAPMEGPTTLIPPFAGSSGGCGDEPPENSANAGERVLASRRAIRDGAYEHAKARWVLTQFPTADLDTIARELRSRYRSTIQPNLAQRTLTGVRIQPIVLTYPAGYAGIAAIAQVRVKIITLETVDAQGRGRKLTTYYVNYDLPKRDSTTDRAGERQVILVSVPQVPAEVMLGIRAEVGSTGAVGRLAVNGLPLLLYDSTGTGASSRPEEWEHGLYLLGGDLQLIDAVLLERFTQVDLLGSTQSLAHLLMSHRSHLASAYLGGFIPLWTRNDAVTRTGGPFGTDDDTDHLVYQTVFQWSDFLLAGARDGMTLGLASGVGSSGLGKAGLLYEIVPTLRRFTTAFEIRGDDPDGDGFTHGTRVCSLFDLNDVQDHLQSVRRATKH